MTTIKDVAKKAGVSVATISRVINDSGYVHRNTKEKVLKVIEELKYKPNNIAVSLNSKKTKTIGLILPDIRNPFFPELSKGIEDIARDNGYNVILSNSGGDIESELQNFEILEQKYVDGIILASNTLQYDHISSYKKPIVLLDRIISENISSVSSKNFEGAKLATKHLMDIGCKQIAHISGPQNTMTARERKNGFLEMVEQEEWFTDDLIIEGNYDIPSSFEATLDLINRNSKIDGIFAGNDLMAIGCLKALYSIGKKVPQEIALIGFDGIILSEITIPEISTISQPIYEMGKTAMELLIEGIEGHANEKVHKLLDVKLIQRESTNKK